MSGRSSQEWLMNEERKRAYKQELKQSDRLEILTGIISGIASGNTLVSTLKKHHITPEVFYRWMVENPQLAEDYDIARKVQAEVLRDEVLKISDHQDDPENPHSVNRDRLRVGSRQWLMARANPERYGEKTQVEARITGGTNIQVNLVTLTQQLKELPLGQKLLEQIQQTDGLGVEPRLGGREANGPISTEPGLPEVS